MLDHRNNQNQKQRIGEAMIDLHFESTSNCYKIALILEELETEYQVIHWDLLGGAHLSPEFGRLNPNHKVPVIVDHAPLDGGDPITLAETGAILVYLAEKHGRFLPTAVRERANVLQWLAWQISGLGPMVGQAGHFIRYAPVKHDYSIARYSKETARLLRVLNGVLKDKEYIAGDYSIADMAAWPWVAFTDRIFADQAETVGTLADYPHLQRWSALVGARPALARVLANPKTAIDSGFVQPNRKLTDEQWSNVYGDRMLAAVGEERE